jgi:hypothetical protein
MVEMAGRPARVLRQALLRSPRRPYRQSTVGLRGGHLVMFVLPGRSERPNGVGGWGMRRLNAVLGMGSIR